VPRGNVRDRPGRAVSRYRSRCGLPPALVFAFLVATGTAGLTAASSEGITGNSGRQGASCNDCHSGGVAPTVEFDGPARVAVDTIATFRFVVLSPSSRQTSAGFNVAVDGGALIAIAGQGTRLEAFELTHAAPKQDVGGQAGWVFLWRSPTTAGSYTLYGAGLSANHNGTRGGDDGALTQLRVEVVAPPFRGDANCDLRLTAADLLAVLAADDPPGCATADTDCDGDVDDADLNVTLAAPFDPSPLPACSLP
jgi:hypothetical protein